MTTTEKYPFTDDMDEISGFGGGYEEACRLMVRAGLEWMDAHPEADPRYRGFKGLFGLMTDDNEDAKALDAAILAACPDCTGAMHHAAVNVVMYVRKNGWEEYQKAMRERKTTIP